MELREGLDGSYTGLGRSELLQRFPLAILPPSITSEGWEHGGDTQDRMFERCHQILNKLQERFAFGDTIVLVLHGGMLTYFFHTLLHISPKTPAWFEIAYGAISRVRLVSQEKQQAHLPLYPCMEVEVLSINDTSHLHPLEKREQLGV